MINQAMGSKIALIIDIKLGAASASVSESE